MVLDQQRAQQRQWLINKISALIDNLPPMPETIIALNNEAKNPNTNFKRLTEILRQDPSLAAGLLKLANSSLFCAGHKVSTIDEAIRNLGLSHLLNFITASVSERIIRNYFSSINQLNEFFTHSKQVALATNILAQSAQLDLKEQAIYWLAGLMHDIGRLVLILASEDQTISLISHNYQKFSLVIHQETNLFGLNHCMIGNKICEKWELPQVVCAGTSRHHNPLANGEVCQPGCYIFLGHLLTLGEELPEQVLVESLPPETLAVLNLSAERLCEARQRYIETSTELTATPA